MASPLGQRLIAVRHEWFVGRAAERALFKSALEAEQLPFHMMHIFGPGGVGKSTLLSEFAYICHQCGSRPIYIDSRNVEPSPETFLNAIRVALGLAPQDSPVDAIASWQGRQVLLIDTYETLGPLDAWLLEVFLPQLPENSLVVFAGRNPPSLAWRTYPGRQAVSRTLSLRNFSPEEGRVFLTKRGVPLEQHQSVLQFTHGHPLALSLVADTFAQRPGMSFQPEAAPDVVKMLLEQLVQKVPGPAHRAALEACAVVHLTTESLLSEMLAILDAHDLFQWLRGLSFIESGPHGLFPHDLAREALVADLRWRNPNWYAELHRRARTYYVSQLPQTSGREQERTLADYIFLHRDNPVVRPFFTHLKEEGGGGALTDTLRPSDVPSLVEMVARHEGEESALLGEHWIQKQPQGVLVFRDAKQQPVGFLSMVALQRATPEEILADPAIQAAWDYLQRNAPLRPGEMATVFRFWMTRDSYQAVSTVQGLIFVNMVRHYLTTPRLAFTFLPCAEPNFWALIFAYADLTRLPEADFQVGGRTYGVYGHDWRVVPPMTWLDILAQREISIAPQPAAPPQPSQPLLVLSQPEFAEAVREALRNYTRPEALAANPLLQSRIVVERSGGKAEREQRIAVLVELLKETAELLQRSPREGKFYGALYHTYLHPAPSQERAAEILEQPYGTYRRHLKLGVDRVTEILWQREIGVWEK